MDLNLNFNKMEDVVAYSEENIKRAVLKLEQSAGWIKFLGIIQLIYGVLTAVTLVGILWIWLGLVLIKVANNLRLAKEGDDEAFVEASQNLATFFTVWGVLAVIGIVIAVIVILIWIIFAGGMWSQMANNL